MTMKNPVQNSYNIR